VARLALLDVLVEGAIETDAVGGIPASWALFDQPARLPLALAGRDASYFTQRQQVTATMLATWQQQLGD
jgi:hypothetical protein